MVEMVEDGLHVAGEPGESNVCRGLRWRAAAAPWKAAEWNATCIAETRPHYDY
jgi:hypothetical protein